jgi:hypothetical protein
MDLFFYLCLPKPPGSSHDGSPRFNLPPVGVTMGGIRTAYDTNDFAYICAFLYVNIMLVPEA